MGWSHDTRELAVLSAAITFLLPCFVLAEGFPCAVVVVCDIVLVRFFLLVPLILAESWWHLAWFSAQRFSLSSAEPPAWRHPSAEVYRVDRCGTVAGYHIFHAHIQPTTQVSVVANSVLRSSFSFFLGLRTGDVAVAAILHRHSFRFCCGFLNFLDR